MTVAYVDKVRNGKGKKIAALGIAQFTKRHIQIRDGMHPTQEFHTLCHEWAHFILWDAGVNNLLSSEKIELLCDAFATALAANECR